MCNKCIPMNKIYSKLRKLRHLTNKSNLNAINIVNYIFFCTTILNFTFFIFKISIQGYRNIIR